MDKMKEERQKCYNCKATAPNGTDFNVCPITGQRVCIACLIQILGNLDIPTFPNQMILKFVPSQSKLKKIFKHSRTARNLWMLYRSTHFYGSPISDYMESDQYLLDCQRFNENFSHGPACIEELQGAFCQLCDINIGWWFAVRHFLGPENYWCPGRQDLEFEVKFEAKKEVAV